MYKKHKKPVISDGADDDEEVSDELNQVISKGSRAKVASNKKQRTTQDEGSKASSLSQSTTTHTGLNGRYWNESLVSGRITDEKAIDYRRLINGNSSSDSSSEEESDTSSVYEEEGADDVLYKKQTFITCRSASDSFYLCQILQDVYIETRKVRIRWCSLVDGADDRTKINANTRFQLDYKDNLDVEAILMGIENVVHHDDGTISLKKKDIAETKRLLEKSIHGASVTSDESTDSSTDSSMDDEPKTAPLNHIHFESNEESDSDSSSSQASTASLPAPKKRKRVSKAEKSKKQPAKKRARKATNATSRGRSKKSDATAPGDKVKRRRMKANTAQSEDGDGGGKSKGKVKKLKPVSKAQLFKVHSNHSLKENTAINVYKKEPFFEDNLPVPFISSSVQSKLAIRAVILNNVKLLKSLINDVDHVCSVHLTRGLFNDLAAIHYAIKNNNSNMFKILLDDLNKPKKDRCSLPTVSMRVQSTGRMNVRTLGFATAKLTASRGAKEGNNALNKDQENWSNSVTANRILIYALKNNCSQEIYDLFMKTFQCYQNMTYENIHRIIEAGHRKLAARIVEEIKDNHFHGFNNLHYQVLLFDNEDLTVNRAASVLKKTKTNLMITPIHCAAINPNVKYIKQLLNITPEYNILDKYERRPIHFAAACEGPDPLEYLLSKHVNFNDVDRGGNAPLHIAVVSGRVLNVELLLRTAKDKATSNEDTDENVDEKFGLASINRANKKRFYPIHLAVLHDRLDCLKILIEYGADVEAGTSTSSGKLTPLMLACQKGYLDIAKYLIEKGAKVEARDRFKRTPLIHACMCGNAHIVSHLLRLGANPDAFDSSLNSALHYAVAYGWYFCVQSLLEAGANLNCVNSWQTTCLSVGFMKGHFGICDYLLTKYNADINFKTEDGSTLVMLTVQLDVTSSVVEQLEYAVNKHKADCNITDVNGNNALHCLAANRSINENRYLDENTKKELYNNYCKLANILLTNNCDPNKANSRGQTPLMIALENRNLTLVDYFMSKAKIQINADVSYDGKTLLHYFAKQCHRTGLVEALFKIPVDQEIKKMGQIVDNSGRTPFHYCAARFNDFCEKHQSLKGNDRLKMSYQSIVRMIAYCLETAECDPDAEIQQAEVHLSNERKNEDNDDDNDDEDDGDKETNDESHEQNEDEENQNKAEEEDENADDEDNEDSNEDSSEDSQAIDDVIAVKDKPSASQLKETSVFHLLRTIPFIDDTAQHPLELFLKKTKNPNVLHHKTHRTPLLEAIHLHQSRTAKMLIQHSLCDINLATSNLTNERQQTPLILACILKLLPVVSSLLEQKLCNITICDVKNNQAIHYYLQTSNRSSDYLETLKLFIKKLQSTSFNFVNAPGNHQRTPLHIAVYHNSGTIDAIIDIEKVLIESGSDLMLKDDMGNIPLHNVFLKKTSASDPVELCALIMKAMKYKSLDTSNKEGDTPLHLAVAMCSTVCVMLLQQHNVSLFVDNNLSNSIIGTCIASSHLNLFITFLQQPIDIDLGRLHKIPIDDKPLPVEEEEQQPRPFGFGSIMFRQPIFRTLASPTKPKKKVKSSSKDDRTDGWEWKYYDTNCSKKFKEHSLIYLIIQHDWQGALSLILNEIERFSLTYLQIIEAAILNNKLNLVLRLLLRLKDEISISETNADKQNLIHLLANMDTYNESLLKQVLQYLYEAKITWFNADKHGSFPLHYACVKRNMTFIDFVREKYPLLSSLNHADSFGNTAIGLLFWSLPYQNSIPSAKLRSLITSADQLDCLCAFDNRLATDPLSFGCAGSLSGDIVYPPTKPNIIRTSPLIHAIVYNNFELAKVLLTLGADVNFADEEKRTPMMHAIIQNNIDIVKLLLNKFYSLKKNEQTPTVLSVFQRRGPMKTTRRRHYIGVRKAVRSSRKAPKRKTVKHFKKMSSVDLNAVDANGRTCIHYLVTPFANGCYAAAVDILHLLHSNGAVITVADHSGLAPIDYAVKNNCVDLYNELNTLTRRHTSLPRPQYENFVINDPNERLLQKPTTFYDDAQEYIDQYIALHAKTNFNDEYKVDSLSGMNATGEILIDANKNEPYDVRLTKTDISYGICGLYNFYRMQIIKHKSKDLYFLFTRWGRIGEQDSQYQLTPFSTIDECRKEFLKVFREKTGNQWQDTDNFEAKPKKYTLVRLNEREIKKYSNVPIDFDRLQNENEHQPSQIRPSVYKNLLQSLINRQAIRKNVHQTRLDVEWMPVSQLKRETLEKAKDALRNLRDTLKKREDFQKEGLLSTPDRKIELKAMIDKIYQYTNEYYTLIPSNNFAEQKLPVLDNDDLLKQQEKILSDLFELELSYKMLLGAQTNLTSIAPADYLYRSMNCQFELMNQNDMDSQLILRYIRASAPTVHIEQLFKIARSNENERLAKCNIDNHHLLWHGTNICNLISIFTRGLLAASLAGTSTGSLFGTGVYTADTFKKSFGYCCGIELKNSERCFMLLCEVALGKIKQSGVQRTNDDSENEDEENDEDDDDDDISAPLDLKRFQSRQGVGKNIPDPKHTVTLGSGVKVPLGLLIENKKAGSIMYGLNYNEYIVYDEAQVALRYLVQFRR